jgi:hypothetical protein
VAAKELSGTTAIEDISNEAGMSAYVKSTTPINLTNAKKAFTRGVEHETADYIIGLVPVPGYSITQDPQLLRTITWDAHVLVHKTGWILAYYPKEYESARVLNEKQQVIGGATKLSLVIDAVISKTGVKFGNKSYYHFQYPDAKKMLVIYFKNGQDPRVKLPSSNIYYEKSLLFYSHSYDKFRIEDTIIIDGWDYAQKTYHYKNINFQDDIYVQMYHTLYNTSNPSWGMIVVLYS